MRHPLLALLACLAAAPVAAQRLSYEGSLGVSSGSYIFPDRTTTYGLISGLALNTGALTLRAAIPVWLQNSTLIAASAPGLPGTGMPSSGPTAGGGAPTGGSSSDSVNSGRGNGGHGGMGATRAAESHGPVNVPDSSYTGFQTAIGDPLASATIEALGGDRFSLSISGYVKFPVSDTSSFGTGEWDFGAGIGSTLRLGERTLLGMDLGWWHLGDMPGLEFEDPVGGTLSLSHLLSADWGGIVFASGYTASIDGYEAPVAVGVGLTRFIGKANWGIQGGAGLTETSPDFYLTTFWRIDL
ncbi:MAG: hypothetical protein OEV95_09625 [Gemmatimonadota bacterium]|nr:hypothetical protein [Gemmatimonadota bacterium]